LIKLFNFEHIKIFIREVQLIEQLLQSTEVLTDFKTVFYIKERHVIFRVRIHSVQTRVCWFGPGCRIPKSVKSGFDKTSNCNNFCPECQKWTCCIWFWGRKM